MADAQGCHRFDRLNGPGFAGQSRAWLRRSSGVGDQPLGDGRHLLCPGIAQVGEAIGVAGCEVLVQRLSGDLFIRHGVLQRGQSLEHRGNARLDRVRAEVVARVDGCLEPPPATAQELEEAGLLPLCLCECRAGIIGHQRVAPMLGGLRRRRAFRSRSLATDAKSVKGDRSVGAGIEEAEITRQVGAERFRCGAHQGQRFGQRHLGTEQGCFVLHRQVEPID